MRNSLCLLKCSRAAFLKTSVGFMNRLKVAQQTHCQFLTQATQRKSKQDSGYTYKQRATLLSKIGRTSESAEHAKILAPLQAAVKELGDKVRRLKLDEAHENEVEAAVQQLRDKKRLLDNKLLELTKDDGSIKNRAKLEDLLKQKFFYDMSFSIYGGMPGLCDFGPMGCAVKANLLDTWRKHFVLEEQMLEVECSILTPEPVLKASGHVERFSDYMTKDVQTGECFRVDHLIEAAFEKTIANKKASTELKAELTALLPRIDSMNLEDMHQMMRKYNLKSPITGNELTDPMEMNLMFNTSIGPSSNVKGFLRPETAQGIFVNFKRLLEFNQGKLPFAAAQIGNAFRNEISGRSGLIRLREFPMAEIEHFCDPAEKAHSKFASIADLEVMLYSACNQMDGELPHKWRLGDAVDQKLIANESLGYFIGRIYQFLTKVGIDPQRLRFRQHMKNEMAHYASDCWDAECKTSYGWIECVGCADRSCYDLSQHAKATGVKLVAEKKLPEPIEKEIIELVPNKRVLSKQFKKEAKIVTDVMSILSEEDISKIEAALNNNGVYVLKVDGKEFTLTEAMVQVKRYKKKFYVQEIVPSVIEPSFGVSRVMYSIFEHNFRIRDGDEQRTYIALPPVIAPYKCSVLPLTNNPDFTSFITQLSDALTKAGVSHKVDTSGSSIGRRYVRTDQIAIPFVITVDFDSLKEPHTATLRERDTMMQIRAKLSELPQIVVDLAASRTTWDNIQASYPAFEQQESTK